jgi:hypothetical protein
VFNVLFSAVEARLPFLPRVGDVGSDTVIEVCYFVGYVASSRPVAIANRIVARTAAKSGVQDLSSVAVFPPR